MTFSAQLKNMTIEEKLHTMELIWDDLCENAAKLDSPYWHKSTIEEREKSFLARKFRLFEWDEAKEHIRNEFR